MKNIIEQLQNIYRPSVRAHDLLGPVIWAHKIISMIVISLLLFDE